MSTPTPTEPAPSVEVDFKLHLLQMDLHFTLANGHVQIAAPDFVKLMSEAKPQHAGLFEDTLKRVLDLTGDPGAASDAPQLSPNRRMFDVLARVEEIRDSLDRTLEQVTGELARLTAMPPIFDDVRDPKTPPAAAQPAPAAPESPVPASAPQAADGPPATAPQTAAPAAETVPATTPTTPNP